MLLPELTLMRPQTLAQALEFAAEPGARLIAGGTGLVPNMRLGVEAPRTLVSLERVGELQAIEQRHDGTLRIGSGVTLQRIADDEVLPAALRAAAAAVGAPAHRSAATLGGNLCLDTRCLYYNQSAEWRASNHYCLKRGGEICHVAPKGNVCRAAFSGDVAAAALALDAEVEIARPGGRIDVRALARLYSGDGAQPIALEPGEIVAAIRIPAPAGRSGYAKARRRGAIDFPLAGVAIAVGLHSNRIAHLRVALTGTNSNPFALSGTETLIGAQPAAAGAPLAKLVQKQVKPLRTTIGAADYRRQVAAVLARRLLERLTKGDSS
ncbi:MAG TPA: FAD binding domain-containing protein [Burkholderiales bacterium]|nr:FAD binding domain-containing protein [Burkholderiales bacterium]